MLNKNIHSNIKIDSDYNKLKQKLINEAKNLRDNCYKKKEKAVKGTEAEPASAFGAKKHVKPNCSKNSYCEAFSNFQKKVEDLLVHDEENAEITTGEIITGENDDDFYNAEEEFTTGENDEENDAEEEFTTEENDAEEEFTTEENDEENDPPLITTNNWTDVSRGPSRKVLRGKKKGTPNFYHPLSKIPAQHDIGGGKLKTKKNKKKQIKQK